MTYSFTYPNQEKNNAKIAFTKCKNCMNLQKLHVVFIAIWIKIFQNDKIF